MPPAVFPARNAALYDLLLRGMRLVSEWTARVLEQSAWKFANPADPATSECPKDAKDYEKVVRYNYKLIDKTALVEVRVDVCARPAGVRAGRAADTWPARLLFAGRCRSS